MTALQGESSESAINKEKAKELKDLNSDWTIFSCCFNKILPQTDVPSHLLKNGKAIVEHKGDIEREFNSIYLLSRPKLYYR